MKLIKAGSNQSIVRVNNNKELFYSYDTVVSARINDVYYKTSFKHSRTTSRHINNYLKANKAIEVSQDFLDNLLDNNVIDITPIKKEILKIKGS